MKKYRVLSLILSAFVLPMPPAMRAQEVLTAQVVHTEGGIVPMEEPIAVDVQDSNVTEKPPLIRKSAKAQAVLPEKYSAEDYGYVTTPKNQGSLGVCWSFAAVAAMETSMVKNGFENVDDVDYSEYHLAYFTHKRDSVTGDGQDIKSCTGGYYTGGHYRRAAQKLVGWQGAELEENYPYGTKDNMPDIDESKRYSSYAHLQNYYELEAEDVKSAIMEYGGVMACYYDQNSGRDGAAYYSTGESGTGHAVFIVGWDDNYDLSNFKNLAEKPNNPGAWRVKNSWGEGSGDHGYFWMSYETAPLEDFIAFDAKSSDNYQIIHQYDGAGFMSYANYQSAANIFTADENQVLKAVGFYTEHGGRVAEDVSYTAEVYKLNESPKNPKDGTLMSVASGVEKYDGYHTAELDDFVPLDAGDKFSVVLSLKNPSGGIAYQAFEGSDNTKYSSNPGESYYFYNNAWKDSSSERNNACIKAYASAENVTVKFDTGGGTELADMPQVKYNTLHEVETPVKDGKYFAGWYTDSACTKLWDLESDVVTGDMTLYAKWSDSPIAVQTITVTGAKKGILIGDSITLKITASPYYATNKEFLLSASDSCVSISDDGVLSGVSEGSATVTVTAKDGGASTQFAIGVYTPMGDIALTTSKIVYKTTENTVYGIYEPNAEYFELYWKAPNGSTYTGGTLTNTKSIINISYLPFTVTGEWKCYIYAYDPLGNVKMSDVSVFMVSDEATLGVKKQQQRYIAAGYNAEDGGAVAVAYYDADGRLLKVESVKNLTDKAIVFNEFSGNYEKAKFLWWDSKDTMAPITQTAELKSTDRTGKVSFGEK